MTEYQINKSNLKARITRQIWLFGALAGINIFLFLGFAMVVFGEIHKPLNVLSLGLAILTVINFVRNRSVLIGSKILSEEEKLDRMERSYHWLSRGKWILVGLVPFFLFGGFFLKNKSEIFSERSFLGNRQLVGKCQGEKLKSIEIRFSQDQGQSNSTKMKYEDQTLFLRNDLFLGNSDINFIEDVVDIYGGPKIKFHLNSQGTVKLSRGMKESYGRNVVVLVDGSIHAAPHINGQINDGKMQVRLVKEISKNGQIFGFSTSDLCTSQ